ncbi:hypothetical protein SUDANB1_05274 [Streptomyces sp. enrichment culture]|uniref:hypothetical protein n=1 Tax=Streptomyces sp. enrichment culture TaxID=1795815 RepID=UPI003F55348A
MSEPDLDDAEYLDPDLDDLDDLDPEDDETPLDDFADGLTDDELAVAIEWLHGRNPLAGYATPVTRARKPNAVGRRVDDVLPTL